jgi:type II secretory pathway component PulK
MLVRSNNPVLRARSASKETCSRQHRGFVLVSVFVVIVLLTLAAYKYSEMMMAEYQAMDSYARTSQAQALAKSGVHYTATVLSDPNSFSSVLNNNPWDNPTAFQDVLVQDNDNGGRRGRFSVLTLRDPSDPLFSSQPYRFGVTDESSKLNLNALLTLAQTDTVRLQMLMQIPNMTEDVANSILDWLDGSSTIPRTNGAKDEYYTALTPTYHVKNGPLDSIEELLLVKGVTPQLLYGNDVNRNGIIDPDEDQNDGNADGGWQQYLSIYSREPNLDSTGNPRIFLNDTNLNNLTANLQAAVGNDLAQFIVAYRLYGGSAGAANTTGRGNTQFQRLTGSSASGVSGQIATDTQSAATQRLTKITSLFDLTTQQVSVPVKDGAGQTTYQTIPNPLMDASQAQTLLPLLFDKTTTQKQSDLTPRINVTTANAVVLSMLPNLQPSDVDQIVQGQPPLSSGDAPDPIYQTPAWLLSKTTLPTKTLSGIETYITARSQVYRFQVVGYYDGPGPTARVEAVVDTNNGRPRIVFYRPMTELGRGFSLPFGNSP